MINNYSKSRRWCCRRYRKNDNVVYKRNKHFRTEYNNNYCYRIMTKYIIHVTSMNIMYHIIRLHGCNDENV